MEKTQQRNSETLKGEKAFDIRKILIRDYRIIARRLNLVLIALLVLPAALSVFLLYNQYRLRTEMEKRVYVQIDNKIYEAVKSEEITRNVAFGFVNMSFSYLFNHDRYNYEANIGIAKEFFRRKSYNYIMSRFNTKSEATEGLTLYEMYQTYDARMSLEIENFQYRPSDMMVVIEGNLRNVFEGQDPKLSRVKFAFQLERSSKSESNPYGLKITALKPLQ